MATHESPTSRWLRVRPRRNDIVNGDFAANIANWTAGSTPAGSGWAQIASYGGTGTGDTQLDFPQQLAKDASGNVWIADLANARVVKRNGTTGAFMQKIDGGAIFNQPSGVTADAVGGHIYVSQNAQIAKYTSAGVFVSATTVAGAASLVNLANDGTHIYATDLTNDKVFKILMSTMATVTSWGTTGSGNTNYNEPIGIAVGGSELFIVDRLNSRIKVTDLVGTFSRHITLSTSDARGVTLDSSGNPMVAEFGGDVVRRYNKTTGALIDSFATTDPHGIIALSGDVLFVGNETGDVVTQWDEYTASTTRSWDGTIGGVALGSYKFAISTATAGAISDSLSSAWIPLNDREAIAPSAWVRSSNVGLTPLLRIIFGDAAGATVDTQTEAVWTPVANTPYGRQFAARTPGRATQYKIGLLAYGNAPGLSGNVWFDDVAVNSGVLVVSEPAMGQLKVKANMRGRRL